MRLSRYSQEMGGAGLWAVEFSQTQGAFHIQPLSDATLSNLGRFVRALPGDYVVLWVARSREEAGAVCDALDKREDRRRPFTSGEFRHLLEQLMPEVELGALLLGQN